MCVRASASARVGARVRAREVVCVGVCALLRRGAHKCVCACVCASCALWAWVGGGVTWYDRHDRRIYGVETKPDLLLPLKVDRLGELQMLPKMLHCGATSCAALRHAALAAVAGIRNISIDR